MEEPTNAFDSGGDVEAVVQTAARESRVVGLMGAAVRWIIIAVLFIVPLAYAQVTQDALFIKAVIIEAAAVIVAALWLGQGLAERRLSFRSGGIALAFLGLAAAMVLSNAVSHIPWASFWGSDPTGEKTASILSFIVLAFVAAATFGAREFSRARIALLASFALLAFFALVSIIVPATGGQMPGWLNTNPVGTSNSLALVLSIAFLFSFGGVMSRMSGRRDVPIPLVALAALAAAAAFADLVFLGFRTLWGVLAAVLAVHSAYLASRALRPDAREGGGRGMRIAAGLGALVAIAAIFLAYRPFPFASIFQPPPEIAPTVQATLSIAADVLSNRPVTGEGPALFSVAYSRYRNPLLNYTPFWTTRFNHGYSYAATIPSTVGLVGVVAYLGFVFIAGWLAIRRVWRFDDPAGLWFGPPVILALAMWFLYGGNFTATFLLVLFVGLMLSQSPARAVGSIVAPAAREESDLDRLLLGRSTRRLRLGWIRMFDPDGRLRTVNLAAPNAFFAGSFVAIFAAVFALGALWSLSTQYLAEAKFSDAVRVLNLYGNVDTARVRLEQAEALNPTEDAYPQGLAQLHTAALQQLISQAAAGARPADLSDRFNRELVAADQASNRAIALAPADATNWFTRGQLYESVLAVPNLVRDADRAALTAYRRAHEEDPASPLYLFLMGRVHLTIADLRSLQINVTSSGDARQQLEAERTQALAAADDELAQATHLKSDYAQAHFLLAQLAVRTNDLRHAIAKTEETLLLAPNDIGVVFQLGVLYYRAGDLDRAKLAFERAVALNDNYSNARYFLGLIWDRKGDRDGALSQFEKIARLNPDNEEIKRIIVNLQSGRPALESIVPPAQPPEKRKEAPVPEERTTRPIRRR